MQSLFGRKIYNPRQLLVFVALWSELPGFSYVPLQLLYFEYSGKLFDLQLGQHQVKN